MMYGNFLKLEPRGLLAKDETFVKKLRVNVQFILRRGYQKLNVYNRK